MPKITIITLTFNRSLFLRRTIESVLSQTFEDFEYIIIDNGSTDDTQSVINQYMAKDNRIFVITRSQNDISSHGFLHIQSILNTRNTLYNMHIDDDDYMETNAVDTLYNLITENNADIAAIGSKWVFKDGTTKDKYVFNDTYVFSRIDAMTELLKREKFNSAPGGKLYRKFLYENINIPTVNQFRDIYREYRVFNDINKMVVTGKPLYYFYRHDSNLSGLDTIEQITPKKMLEHLDANKLRTQWLTEKMPEISNYVFYCELSFMISLYERIHRLQVKSCFYIANEMRAVLLQNKQFLAECRFLKEQEKDTLRFISIPCQ